jgi:hypothetical protein
MIKQKNFSCIVFDLNIVPETGQPEGQRTKQKLKFLSHTEPQDHFSSSAQIV